MTLTRNEGQKQRDGEDKLSYELIKQTKRRKSEEKNMNRKWKEGKKEELTSDANKENKGSEKINYT